MNVAVVEDSKNNIVKKHQELVRNARYKLSELGIKTIAILISQINVSDEDFKEYAVKIDDIKKLAGDSKTKNTKHYVDIVTEDLMSKPFWIKNERFNWVTYARWEEGSNIVLFEIHRKLKPYLLELQKNFLQYNIANILPLKSSYIIRLYELCKDRFMEETRYKTKKKSVQFEFKIDRMRELFEIPQSYQYSSHIKKRVLEKAAQEFKEKTDIQMTYTEQKIGRKVDRIIITVKANDKGSADPQVTKKGFIEYVRDKYKPSVEKGTFPTIISTKNGDLKVDRDGKLYISQAAGTLPGTLDHLQADKLWDWLYNGVKSGEFELVEESK